MTKFNFSRRERRIFSVVIVVCFVYSVYLSVYLPLKKKKESLAGKIRTAQRELNNNRKKIQKSRIFQEKYKTILANYKQKASDEQVMASILSEIEKVNEAVDVRISDKKPKKSKKLEIYNHFSVSLSLEGELAEVARFIHILQNPPHMFGVDELRLDKRSLRTVGVRCRVVLSRVLIP